MTKKAQQDIVRAPFCQVVAFTNYSTSSGGGTAAELDISTSAIGGRLFELGTEFQKYRIVDLTAEVVATGVTGMLENVSALQVAFGWSYAIAYDPNPSSYTGSISNLSAMAQLERFDMSNCLSRNPKIHIPRKVLVGENPLRWLETTATGTPSDLSRYQGTLYVGAYSLSIFDLPATPVYHVKLSGVVEFCSRVVTADAVLLKRFRELQLANLRPPTSVHEMDSKDSELVIVSQDTIDDRSGTLPMGTGGNVPPSAVKTAVVTGPSFGPAQTAGRFYLEPIVRGAQPPIRKRAENRAD